MLKGLILLSMLPFAIACSSDKGKTIVNIPEASGIDYCSNSDTFVVANDEGSYYEIDDKGGILKQTKLGNHDFEGVVCLDDKFIFAVEDRGLMIVDRNTKKKKALAVNTTLDGKRIKLIDKKNGIEGIAKNGNTIYLSKQSKKRKKSFIAITKFTPFPPSIKRIIHHGIIDTSGLTYHDGYLYMVSDKKDLLIKYNLKKDKIIKKIKLPKGAWEGITFDNKGYLYLADDDGRVVKFKVKDLLL